MNEVDKYFCKDTEGCLDLPERFEFNTGKTAEIPERPKNNRDFKNISTKFMPSDVLTCLGQKAFFMFITYKIVSFLIFNHLFKSCLFKEMINRIKA